MIRQTGTKVKWVREIRANNKYDKTIQSWSNFSRRTMHIAVVSTYIAVLLIRTTLVCLIYVICVICVCLRIVVSKTYCVVFLLCFFFWSSVPYAISLDCPFFISPLAFSNVCLQNTPPLFVYLTPIFDNLNDLIMFPGQPICSNRW
jgi:uncharacterized membrane protein